MNNVSKLKPVRKLNNASLTGYKIFKILKLLKTDACSDADINMEFLKDKLLKKAVSKDTICLYINTLRKIGCDISRPTKTNSYKYVLKYNPFDFTIKDSEHDTLCTIMSSLIRTNDWKFILEVNDAFNELKKQSQGKNFDFLGIISDIANIDKKIILELQKYCSKKRIISVDYSSPSSLTLKKITLIPDEMFIENEKFYLWGYNFEKKEMQYIRIDRIKSIKSVSIKESKIPAFKTPIATFKIKNELCKTFIPESHQKILSRNENELLIQEPITNKFKFIQKILSYGENCLLLSPKTVVEEVKLMLEFMERTYEN